MLSVNSAIELAGVAKEFGSHRVLDGLEFRVPVGAITVLLGPSGAGKTVTIRHILGLIDPDKGAVRVLGQDLSEISEEEVYALRRRMSVVIQGALPFTCGLFYSLNVHQNVAYGLQERTKFSKEDIDRRTSEALGMVGMKDQGEKMPSDLSGGESKRVALARALALESGILIIDDLDAGLDSVRLSLLCRIIKEAQEDTDCTVLVTTHDMTVARERADYVAMIRDGRIIASGPADEVLESDEPYVKQFVSGDTEGPITLKDE